MQALDIGERPNLLVLDARALAGVGAGGLALDFVEGASAERRAVLGGAVIVQKMGGAVCPSVRP